MTGVVRRAIARSFFLPTASSSVSLTDLAAAFSASAGMSTSARSGGDEAIVADPSSSSSSSSSASKERFEWCVVGAGPAGIATVGLLLDASVPPAAIAWVDPEFRVGDFGTKWRHVSSNTTVGLFLRFYGNCKSFEFSGSSSGSSSSGSGSWKATTTTTKKKKEYAIESIPEKQTCELETAAEPLHDITAVLRAKVVSFRARVEHLKERNAAWECELSGMGGGEEEAAVPASIAAANVVLATGAEPRRALPFHTATGADVIPLATALDPGRLAAAVAASDTVAVFGSSHSAVMIVRELLERTSAAAVINFYREPLRYALYMGDWILFDDTGLKGDTARWSREHLHGDLPARLRRAYSDDASIAALLPQCSKVIYATGFERRPVPRGVLGLAPSFSYNPHCGIIAPGLFGCGIGYPEQRTDRYGTVELRVGLWKFMDYLQRVLPLWMQYSVSQGIGQPKGAPGTPSAPPPPTTTTDGIVNN